MNPTLGLVAEFFKDSTNKSPMLTELPNPETSGLLILFDRIALIKGTLNPEDAKKYIRELITNALNDFDLYF